MFFIEMSSNYGFRVIRKMMATKMNSSYRTELIACMREIDEERTLMGLAMLHSLYQTSSQFRVDFDYNLENVYMPTPPTKRVRRRLFGDETVEEMTQ
jgi:hypothetical protein